MDEKVFAPYYEKIANQLNEIIPDKWIEIVMYAEELGDVRSAIFYFKQANSVEFVYGNKIPDIYGVDRKTYFNLLKGISNTVKELRSEFIKLNMQPWSAITFFLDQSFKFKTEFHYELQKDVGCYERGVHWAYENLSVSPTDEFGKQVLQEYLTLKEA